MDAPGKKRKRRSFWDRRAETCFVELWGDKIGELRGARKNTHVYKEMASDLAKQGYDLSVLDIKYKIANLTAKYRKYQEAIGPSGDSPTRWLLYEAVHKVIGAHRINNADVVLEESIGSNSHEPSAVLASLLVSLPSSSPSSPFLSSHRHHLFRCLRMSALQRRQGLKKLCICTETWARASKKQLQIISRSVRI